MEPDEELPPAKKARLESPPSRLDVEKALLRPDHSLAAAVNHEARHEPVASTSAQLNGARDTSLELLPSDGRPHYELKYTLEGHKRSVSSIKFSPDGKWIASSSADKPIHIHSLPSFTLYRTLNSHTLGVSDVSFSSDSCFLASASDDKTVRIWEIQGAPQAGSNQIGGEKVEGSVRVLRGHEGAVFCVGWNPRGDLVASGSMDETIRVWDVQKGTCLRTLPAHSDPVSGVEFSRDGTMIVSGSWDGYIRIWDTATGQCLKTLVDDDNTPVSNVFFTPNSKFIFVSTLDSKLSLWNYQADKTVKSYLGHVNKKFCITSALTASGRYLVAGSEDHKMIIWDLQTREVVQSIESHRDVVMAIACHPSIAMIASVGLEKDPTIKIWLDRNDPDSTLSLA